MCHSVVNDKVPDDLLRNDINVHACKYVLLIKVVYLWYFVIVCCSFNYTHVLAGAIFSNHISDITNLF